MHKALGLLIALLLVLSGQAAVAQGFPKLTGRVVDQADLLDPQQEAALTAKLAGLETRTVAPRCPRVLSRHSQWRTIAEWRSLGVMQQQRVLRDTQLAVLFQPDGPGTPAWLLTENYRVILDYNCSNFYALSVGLLADEIARPRVD